MQKNIIYFLICMLVFLNCTSVANAEMKTYEGVGESIMSERENANIAKEGAKLLAIKNAQDKAGVFISGNTQVKDNKLVKDDIVALTAEVVNLGEVKYEVIPLNITETLVTSYYRATLSVTIDTASLENKISQYLNKNSLDRATIIAQNNELVKAVDDVKAKNEEVKTLIAAAKTPQDNAKIKEELKALDRATLYAQKISEGNNYFKAGNSEMAQKLYREAIELYPNDATIAYEKLGDTYRLSGNYDKAIEAYTKVIQMDSIYSVSYYKRGAVYYFLQDYEKAAKDLEITLKHSPDSFFVLKMIIRSYIHLGDYNSASLVCNMNPQIERKDYRYTILKKYVNELNNVTNSINKLIDKLNNDANFIKYESKDYEPYYELNALKTTWLQFLENYWNADEDPESKIRLPNEREFIKHLQDECSNEWNRIREIEMRRLHETYPES